MTNDIELKENLPKNEVRQADADEIEARRVAQFQLRLQGYKRADVIEKLKDEFGIESHIVDNDWKCREKWIGRAAELSDVNSIIASVKGNDEMALQNLKDSLLLINQSIEKYKDKETGGLDLSPDLPTLSLISMRDRFTKTLTDINKNYRDNMSKLGILKEAPKRMEISEHSVRHVMDWAQILEILQPVFEKHPDARTMVEEKMRDYIYNKRGVMQDGQRQ